MPLSDPKDDQVLRDRRATWMRRSDWARKRTTVSFGKVKDSGDVDDPYSLNRFVQAQEGAYERALSEIENGRKRSHWMWFIFPQFEGLGSSAMSRRYAIKSVAEARAYLDHPVLGARLTTCAEALLGLGELSANQIFGSPDDRKLRSCATLFASVSPPGSVFHRLLDKYFHSVGDQATLRLLA